jgi:hypothetical protein
MPMEENKEIVGPSKQGDVGLLREPVAQQLFAVQESLTSGL